MLLEEREDGQQRQAEPWSEGRAAAEEGREAAEDLEAEEEDRVAVAADRAADRAAGRAADRAADRVAVVADRVAVVADRLVVVEDRRRHRHWRRHQYAAEADQWAEEAEEAEEEARSRAGGEGRAVERRNQECSAIARSANRRSSSPNGRLRTEGLQAPARTGYPHQDPNCRCRPLSSLHQP